MRAVAPAATAIGLEPTAEPVASTSVPPTTVVGPAYVAVAPVWLPTTSVPAPAFVKPPEPVSVT